jgi:tetratricopeptide (TPR) repeat protein
MRIASGSLLYLFLVIAPFGCGPRDPAPAEVGLKPADPIEEIVRQADAACEAKEWDRLLAIADEGLRKAPQHSMLRMFRGIAHDGRNELDAALADLDAAVQADPKNARALRSRAGLLHDFDRVDDALGDVEAALRLDHNDATAHAYRAGLWGRQPQKAEQPKIEAEFAEAIRLNPKACDSYLRRFAYRLDGFRLNEARADLEKVEELDKSRQHVDKARCFLCILNNEWGKAREISETLSHDSSMAKRRWGHIGLSYCFRNEADFDRADAALTKALQIRQDASYLALRAEIRVQADKYRKAMEDVDEYLRMNPRGKKELFALRAECLAWGFGKRLEALEDYGRALKFDPNWADGYEHRAEIHRSLFHARETLADCDARVRLQPNDPHAYEDRGSYRAELGQWAEAEKDLTRAIEIGRSANSEHKNAFLPARSYVNRAYCRMRLGRMEEAIVDANEAVRLAPDKPAYSYVLANLLYRSEQAEKAKEILDRLIQRHPGEVDVLAARAACLTRLGRPAEAAADLAQMRTAPRDAYGYFAVQYLLDPKVGGDIREAFADHSLSDELVRRNPENIHARLARVQELRGAGEFAGAIEECDRVIERDPENWFALSERAALLRDRQPARAIADCDRGIGMNPAHYPFWLSRGIARCNEKDYVKAVADLDEAIRLRPFHEAAYRIRSQAWKELGRAAKASDDLAKAKNLGILPFLDEDDLFPNDGVWDCLRTDLLRRYVKLKELCAAKQNSDVVRMWTERQVDPILDVWGAHFAVSVSLLSCRKTLDALAEANEALRLEPNREVVRGLVRLIHRQLQHFPETLALAQEGAGAMRADCLLNLRQNKLAEEAATNYLNSNPVLGKAPTFACRGCSRLRMGDFKGAIADLEESGRLAPNCETSYALALARYDSGDVAGALKELQSVIGSYPTPEAWRAGGICLRKVGNIDLANMAEFRARSQEKLSDGRLSALDEAIRQDPKNVLAYAARARLRLDRREPKLAVTDSDRALELDPLCWIALEIRATALVEADPDHVIADCTRGLELNPGWIDFRTHRAAAYFRKRDYGRALADLDEVIRARPRSTSLHLQRSEILDALGEKPKADADRARAKELGPDEFTPLEVVMLKGALDRLGLNPSKPDLPSLPSSSETTYAIAPPPPTSSAPPTAKSETAEAMTLKVARIDLMQGWKIEPDKKDGKSKSQAPTVTGPAAPPPAPLAVSAPVIPLNLPPAPCAKTETKTTNLPATAPVGPPPPLVLQTSFQEPVLPSPPPGADGKR